MIFGPTPLEQARGGVLAHSLRLPDGGVLRKGVRLGDRELDQLRRAGVLEPVVAVLEEGDVDEDAAAQRAARALAGSGIRVGPPRAGRCAAYAAAGGVLEIDTGAVRAANLEVPELQVSTLPAGVRVQEGQMVTTVKALPFALPGAAVRRTEELLAEGPALRIHPFRPLRVRLLVTEPEGVGERALALAQERVLGRIEGLGGVVVGVDRVPHREGTLSGRLGECAPGLDLLLVYGGASTADPNDVLPRALRAAGGRVERFGMPVDPGNLLLLGALGPLPVVGVPACARSPADSGVDRILERIFAGLPTDAQVMADFGVGGLLRNASESVAPRHTPPPEGGVAGVVLAAGASRRMGERDKLLVEVGGVPMVRAATAAALGADLDPVVVVVRDDADGVRAALEGLPVEYAVAPDADEGLSRSLAAGVGALPFDAGAAVILLGDMPGVQAEHVRCLTAAWSPREGRSICVPVHGGHRGNPVLWDRAFFDELRRLDGDRGARPLLDRYGTLVVEVEVPDDGVLVDVDTPEQIPPGT